MKKHCLAVDAAKDDAMTGLFSPPSQNGEPIPIAVMRKAPPRPRTRSTDTSPRSGREPISLMCAA